ncbi:protein NTM1-like 9 isoform X1 [Juglans microcarpa x Juglans regia]|uniref:protein NTM1-like 9 isoform X1 n=1 Tax=Juglans microcarpa x Juglans regia TaxID=2249226 RepID=UPI001B7E5C5B|nr:protein NTM1-like 9 isoform X1 [Juglans microcarpa x Juglans regia]
MDALSLKVRPWMRFNPPKDQVIDFFLRAKITGNDELVDFIPEAQCCKWEPWDLKVWLDSRCIKTAYPEWWFFSRLDLKHRSGNRSNRATNAGYWKVTGKDKKIMSELGMIGKKKFLVFYRGRGKGEKTNWTIHEYHIAHPGQNAFVLCRLSYKHEKKSIKDPNFNDAGPAVSSPAASNSCLEEYESELHLASVFPASEVQATTTPVVCYDQHFSAHAAENQLGELTTTNDDLQLGEASKMTFELQQLVACEVLTPSTSPHNTLTVSSPTTAKSSLEEIEFALGLDLVSPEEYFDGKALNTIASSNCNQNSYDVCTARNEVPDATACKFEEGLSMFDLLPEPPDCNLSSSFPLDTQFDMSYPVTNDSHNTHCGMYFQYGASEPAANGYEFSDPTLDFPSEYIQNTFVSQKNLTLVSIKDNVSCSGSDAKIANKLLECCDQNSYNAYTAKNEVPEATASEVDFQFKEGLSMSDLLPEPPDWILSSPHPLDMQFDMSYPISDDLKLRDVFSAWGE